MLALRNVHAAWGAVAVLNGVDLQVRPGEIVALLGRNGSGRSTLLKAVMGQLPVTGSIQWQGHDLAGLRPFEIARHGVGYVPESRDVFAPLTVHDNLRLGEKPGAGGARSWIDEAYRCFPALRERAQVRAGVLSGGEQQMLSLARTLVGQPRLLLVDEPTEGLAPVVVAAVATCLKEQRDRGVAVLLVEQRLSIALDIADRCVVMGAGRIVFAGSPSVLMGNAYIRKEWLEV